MRKRPDVSQSIRLSSVAVTGDFETLAKLLAMWQFDRARLNETLLRTAESCSVASGHCKCVELLLGAGASVQASGPGGVTFLMRICCLGQVQLVELALERGARVRDCDCLRRTPLHYAIESQAGDNSDVVKSLIDHGADPNACDNAGRSPLHYAAIRGAYRSVGVLLQCHAFVGLQDKAHHTALDLAVAGGHQRCVDCFKFPQSTKPTPMSSPVGEELETKSGSSLSSCQLTMRDQSAQSRAILPNVQRLLTSKRLELAEERLLLQTAEQELAVLRRECEWLQQEIRAESTLSAEEHQRLEAECTALSGPAIPPLLQLQKQPVLFDPADVMQRLQEDIDSFLKELDEWQVSVSPLIARAIEQWRTYCSKVFPGSQTRLYGSVANDLHLPTSAVDLVLLIPHSGSVKALRKLAANSHLEPSIISASLDLSFRFPLLHVAIACEKVEIRLKITAADMRHRGLKCTELVREALQTTPRLREVYLTLKQITRVGGCDDTQRGGLCTYGLFLMTAESVKREVCSSAAEHVQRFLSYFGFEFDYRASIPATGEFEYAQLLISDPASPKSNIGSRTDLSFLIVTRSQRFLQAACFSLQCRSACPCPTAHHVFLKVLCQMHLASR